MKITRIEIDGELYRVTRSYIGTTYCEECALGEKCKRKNEKIFPCNLIDDEEIFVKE